MSVLMIVFDMAGTTVDEDNVVYKTLQDAIVHYSCPVTLAQVLEFGAGKEKLQAIIDILENTGFKVNSENIDLIFTYFNDMLAKNYDTLNVKPLPDVERTFKELKERNIKVVLNTGYNRKTAESLIVKLGWEESNQFDLLITASDVNNNRPQPDMILLAMSKLSILDPKKVIKVGDSTVDVQEGQNAECLLSIGITTGAHTHEQLREADPDFIIDNVSELIGIIDYLD
ncbi:phosphonatase-like hydrolase [Daejeonella rubra]|uniref:Phosphonatase-like hydrolase n=1 Tax=Daejeonella rubra TaxID=990371 RepID=A0A1G9PY54_9SPHI|nr:phosphonatase-like hydrolase [Daejeonella rubra]SDM03015.1 phosphonatase-like hydrolase [Daejeonella rubra]